MSDLIKLLSVNLDEVYCMKKNCGCKDLSAKLFDLSGKMEECCSNVSSALSDIYVKIENISSQISAEDPYPPTIFAYSTEDSRITAMLNSIGAWNMSPFPGYISSADTELMMKLSSVMHFDFPAVAELEDYNHSWGQETINAGAINYCSYSEKLPVGYKYLSRNLISASYENNSLSVITTVEEPPTAYDISVSYTGWDHPTWPPHQFIFGISPYIHTVKAKDGNKYWIENYIDLNLEGHRIYMYDFGYDGPFRNYFVKDLELSYVVSSDTFDIIPHHDPTPPM